MHVCAATVTAAGTPGGDSPALRAMADGSNLSTLAFSERGSRSHFWAPVSQLEGSRLSAQKSFVTTAGQADSYVVSTRPAQAASPIESSLYLVASSATGITLGGAWDGLGLRGNASAPMTFDVDTEGETQLGEAGKGLDLMLGVVLPWFQLGQGAVSLGLAETAMTAAVAHVSGAKLEHLGQTLADLPTVRARLGRAQTEVDTVGRVPFRRRATDGRRRPQRAGLVGEGDRERDGDPGHLRGDASVRWRGAEQGAPDRARLPRRARRLGDGADHGRALRADGSGARGHAAAVRGRT